jgi:hypothetical protein
MRNAVGEIDDRILPAPRQLVAIGKTHCNHTGDSWFQGEIGRRENREPGAFGNPDQHRFHATPPRRKVDQRPVIRRNILGTERVAAGKAFQVGFGVEPHHEVSARGQDFCDVRTEMHPAAVAARDKEWPFSSRAVQMEHLRAAADRECLLRVTRRGTQCPREATRHQ